MAKNRIPKNSYAAAVRIAKCERRVVSTAMKLHAYKPKHGFGEPYESHKAYLTGQLHRACDALEKALNWHAAAKLRATESAKAAKS